MLKLYLEVKRTPRRSPRSGLSEHSFLRILWCTASPRGSPQGQMSQTQWRQSSALGRPGCTLCENIKWSISDLLRNLLSPCKMVCQKCLAHHFTSVFCRNVFKNLACSAHESVLFLCKLLNKNIFSCFVDFSATFWSKCYQNSCFGR